MGFGFVVARFGLFLQQLRFIDHAPALPNSGFSLWFGTALIATGIVVNLFSAWRHARLVRELDRGQTECARSLTQTVATALFLAVVGLAMAIYLVSVRGTAKLQSSKVSEFKGGLFYKPLEKQVVLANSDIEIPFGIKEAPMATAANTAVNKGIIDKPSNHSVDKTVEKLKSILQAKGVTLFALVDHSGEAEKAGMKMPPTKLLIFGIPKAGTPLMLAAPRIAIDLPLKILVWQDMQGKVWLSYNSPDYLKDRHGLSPDLLQNIAVVDALATNASG